jgi:hypothetical protein
MVIWYILWSFGIFYGIWHILWSFGLFYGHLVYFSRFGMLQQENSGNPELQITLFQSQSPDLMIHI